MTSISHMLDTLSNYQSEVDYLEIEKNRLFNEVKTPAEVLAAQDNANKKRQDILTKCAAREKDLNLVKQTLLDEIVDPPLPPEYQKAMFEAKQKREQINSEFSQLIEKERKAANDAANAVDDELNKTVGEVFNALQIRKEEIAIEFSGKKEAAQANINKLTDEIKKAILDLKESVKGAYLMGVYTKGRTTWKTDILDDVYFRILNVRKQLLGFIATYDELSETNKDIDIVISQMELARKVGDPSIAIRKI